MKTLFSSLSDDQVLSTIKAIRGDECRLLAQVIAALVEIEDRRIHLKEACPSMWDFCIRKLGLSEGETFRRLNAARLVRQFPSLLERIAGGDIHLSALHLLRDHLSEST